MPRVKRKLRTLILAPLLLASALPIASHAGSVSLLPMSPIADVTPGALVSFDLVIDFSDVGGTLGGGFDLRWDPTALGFMGLTSAGLGDPDFGRDPDILDGLLSSWAVGDFNGIADGLVGSVDFEVLPSMGLSTLVALGPTNGIGGPFVGAQSFTALQDVQYDSIAVSRIVDPGVIPLPAALWLFATALIGLAGYTRGRKTKPIGG